MVNNIMRILAIVLMVAEIGALIFLICAWRHAKKEVDNG